MKQSPTEYILALARSFPCLGPKLRWWNPASFDAEEFHDMIGGWSTSERHAAHFDFPRAGQRTTRDGNGTWIEDGFVHLASPYARMNGIRF